MTLFVIYIYVENSATRAWKMNDVGLLINYTYIKLVYIILYDYVKVGWYQGTVGYSFTFQIRSYWHVQGINPQIWQDN